jgi:hypothetical protein
MNKRKKISNSFSTGGGGTHFEAHVQASFAVLMLTGGHAPCLPCWPITEIKLQGKIDGFDTDDLIVVVENDEKNERRKLIGQVKHSITITEGCALFGEVIQAAWNDFCNPKVFTKNKDIIALITGPLSATDEHNVQWLLNQARHTKNVDEFFRNIEQANFSPSKSKEKLKVFQSHLKTANSGNEVQKDELYSFLNHFYLLGYDLGSESGVVLSLLHSHISQFHQQYPEWAWSRVVDIVQSWNQDAGTITLSKLPEDLRDAFKQRAIAEIPKELLTTQEMPKTNWEQHADATYLALLSLVGAWSEKKKSDIDTITQLLGLSYESWLQKAREILCHPDSPLSLKNGIWRIVNRTELWNLLGSHILDQNLDSFGSIAVDILKEPDPAFQLPTEERITASIQGKVLKHSSVLRKGIAEGLAILGSQSDACSHCSERKADEICIQAIHEILTDADWILWGSLNSILPILSEAAPGKFLDIVESTLSQVPCPFYELFSQEGCGITGGNFLTGLLWALEGLAWDEQYLVRVCIALGELANHDPGGQWTNRPSNSLITILLPWLPQTLATVDKRKVAVRTLLTEWPNIAWNLILQLLPGEHQTSSGSYKPSWRKIIPENRKNSVTNEEYWLQVSYYSELAVTAADHDTIRLSAMIDRFDKLHETAFNKLIEVLSSQTIAELHEDQRLLLWDHLIRFTNKHRRFSNAKWALPEKLIIRIEDVARQLAPTNPFNLYQHLFSNRDYDFYEQSGDWEEQRKMFDEQRDAAIVEIFEKNGLEAIIHFAESVASPERVGFALGVVSDDEIEKIFLPHYLNTMDNKHTNLVSGFIHRQFQMKGWKWCDDIDKTSWASEQISNFLINLPFTKETWDRASRWLGESQGEYWSRTGINAYQADNELPAAIEKLLEYDRAHSAVNCLGEMLQRRQPVSVGLCVRALLASLSSNEPAYSMDEYYTIELIKFLQSEPSVLPEDLFKVEWAYLPLLEGNRDVTPKLLESRLASHPEFFCEVIRLIYRSKNSGQAPKDLTEDDKAIAMNAWRLLHEWGTPPGTQDDGTFNVVHFTEWIKKVKELCMESGHLEVALVNVGEALIHSPSDPDGLWIHHAVAAALNDREAEAMRSGFRTGIYNSRGVHWIDPTGKPEQELAEQFRRKAEEVENAGYQRFAITLRDLADGYTRESERIAGENLLEAQE